MNSAPLIPDWYNQTVLHPIGLLAVAVLGFALLIVPRRYALVPLLIMACFISPAQRVVALTLDFNLLRLMVLFGWARVLLRGEMSELKLKTLDILMILWAVAAVLTMSLLHGTTDVLVNRLGFLFDALGMYLLFRCLVRDWSDLAAIGMAAAVISVPVAAVFIIEKTTGRNMFAVFGGVHEVTQVRAGHLRCTGAFAHPILAGAFWVALMPLIGALWVRDSWSRFLAPVGIVGAMVVVITCTSSTPLLAVLAGVIAAAMYPLRKWMSLLRWGLVAGLCVLQIVMNNPVWHLIARVDVVDGSQGWHRYLLINEFVQQTGSWWALGGSLDWGRPLGIDDITNQYVLQGVHGGIVTLGLFIAVIVVAFRDTGRILQTSGQVAFRRAIAWALGVSLFIHTFIFFGTSYFGQIIMIWYLALAMIASMAPTSSEWSLVRNARVVLRKRQRRRTTGVRPITAPEASAT
ncbi:MAG: hypothetical protein ACYTGR_00960 [Planctomycetota bacterium]